MLMPRKPKAAVLVKQGSLRDVFQGRWKPGSFVSRSADKAEPYASAYAEHADATLDSIVYEATGTVVQDGDNPVYARGKWLAHLGEVMAAPERWTEARKQMAEVLVSTGHQWKRPAAKREREEGEESPAKRRKPNPVNLKA